MDGLDGTGKLHPDVFKCGIKNILSAKSESKEEAQCCITVQHLYSFISFSKCFWPCWHFQSDWTIPMWPPPPYSCIRCSTHLIMCCMGRVQRSRWCQRLVSVNMVCSFLTVLKPLTVSTNSSSSMNCKSRSGFRSGFRSEPVQTLVSERAQHTFLGSLTIPLSCRDVLGSHTSSSPTDFTSISWLTLRLRVLTLRTPSSPWGGTSPTGSHLASSTSWRGGHAHGCHVHTQRCFFLWGLDLPPSSCWSLWGSHCQPSPLCQVECQTGGVVRS